MCPNRTFTLLILYYLAERSCHSGAKSAEIRKRSRGVSAPGFAPEKSAVTPLRPPFLLFFINACPGTFRGVIPASGFPVRRDRRKMRQTVKLFFIFLRSSSFPVGFQLPGSPGFGQNSAGFLPSLNDFPEGPQSSGNKKTTLLSGSFPHTTAGGIPAQNRPFHLPAKKSRPIE